MSTPRFRAIGPSTGWPWALRRHLAILTSRLPLFAMVALVALAASLTVDRVSPRTYSSSTRLEVEPRPITTGPGAPAVRDLEFMQTQTEVVKSSRVIGAVVDELQLSNRLDDISMPLDQMGGAIDDLDARIGLRPAPVDAATAHRLRAIELLSRRTAARAIRDTYVLEITVSSRDASLSQRIAKSMRSAYVRVSTESRLQQLKALDRVLTQRVEDSFQRVRAAEAQLGDFNAANSAGPIGASTLSTRQTLEDHLAAERSRVEFLNRQLDGIKIDEAAIEAGLSPVEPLDQPGLAAQPDGLGFTFRILIYLLVAPLLGVVACYISQSLDEGRRVLTPLVARRA